MEQKPDKAIYQGSETWIGRKHYNGGSNSWNGWIDELRVYTGAAVHTSGYTVEASAFTNPS